MKLSLEMTEEIKSTMATREGLSHLEDITQSQSDEIKSSVHEINEKMSNYQITLANQAVIIDKHQVSIASHQDTIAKLNESLIMNDRKMMIQERQNESQRFIIAKLNAERDQMFKEIKEKNQIILQLTKDNLALRSSQGSASAGAVDLNQFRELLAEFVGDRKRKHDDE